MKVVYFGTLQMWRIIQDERDTTVSSSGLITNLPLPEIQESRDERGEGW